jgi:hypothetical protein
LLNRLAEGLSNAALNVSLGLCLMPVAGDLSLRTRDFSLCTSRPRPDVRLR